MAPSLPRKIEKRPLGHRRRYFVAQFTVKKNEHGVLLRNGDFERVLRYGTHWLFEGFDKINIESFALAEPEFRHDLANYIFLHMFYG